MWNAIQSTHGKAAVHRIGIDQTLPDQWAKKKNLRASEVGFLLKIEGFAGKFQTAANASEGGQAVATPKPVRHFAENDRHRPDASFKIKDSLRQISQTQPVVKVQKTEVQQFKVEARDVIDERKVVAALERYIQDHRPEPTVAIALKTHRPEIDGENIVLAVDNQLQQDKLEALKMHLRNVLMKL